MSHQVSKSFEIFYNSQTHRMDNVVLAGSVATKSLKGNVMKMFSGLTAPTLSSSSSSDEREPLLRRKNASRTSIDNNGASTGCTSSLMRFFVSLFFLCPCINDSRVIIPVDEYPLDLDAKLARSFESLCATVEADWFRKLDDARHTKEQSIKRLHNSKEERVEKEYARLIGTNANLTLTSTSSRRFQAFANVREFIRRDKDRINAEFERSVEQLYLQHYNDIVDKECEMLISFWKRVRLAS